MAPDTRPDHAPAAQAVAEEIGFARRLLRRIGGRLGLAFLCIALPLWAFGELAEDVVDGEPFGFDEPLLTLIHHAGTPDAEAVFLFLSAVGFAWGVVPADIVLVLVLTLSRRLREATFSALSLGGSALLNMAAKHTFRRERPALWESMAPEATYSFPSAHAMGSAALAATLVTLAWPTRWRVPVIVVSTVFVIGVGLSRIYLGVHYPSDILAGWAAAAAWTMVTYLLVFRRGVRPWAAIPR